jgi:hypothetical protein
MPSTAAATLRVELVSVSAGSARVISPPAQRQETFLVNIPCDPGFEIQMASVKVLQEKRSLDV